MMSTSGLIRLSAIAVLTLAIGCARPAASPPVPTAPSLSRPESPKPEGAAPDQFRAKFETSKGAFIVQVTRSWSPNGADRFYELVKAGFYDDCRFFRVLPNFMAQVGINGDPTVMARWRDANIDDDPVVESNRRGYVTFAKAPFPNSRSTQFFINFGDNSRLDSDGFSPFGQVVEAMEVVDSIESKHGEDPDQGRLQEEGNAYLQQAFPDLDFIVKATLVESENSTTKETP